MLQTFDAIMQPLIARVYLLHKTKKYKVCVDCSGLISWCTGIQKGSSQFNETANPPIDIIYTDKAGAETLNLVATGRADAAGEYEYVINSAIKDRGLPLKAVGDVLAVVPTYFLSKRTDDMKQVNEKIDKTMKEMRADGTLKKLSEQYLGGDYTFDPTQK